MAPKWNFEQRKSFPVPYEELFSKCREALIAMSLKIIRIDYDAGTLEAEKTRKWPFGSAHKIAVTVDRDSRVKAVAEVNLGFSMLTNLSAEDLVTEKFFESLKEKL